MSEEYIERETAIGMAISGKIRTLPTTEDGEDWIRVEEVRESLQSIPSADVAPVTGWIPVTERLPEHEYGEGTSVLTVDLYGVMRVAYFNGGNWCWPTGETVTTTRIAPITHWMPLPEPPKEEN